MGISSTRTGGVTGVTVATPADVAEGSPGIDPEAGRWDTGRRRTKSCTTGRGMICQSTQMIQATVIRLMIANRRQNSVEPNRVSVDAPSFMACIPLVLRIPCGSFAPSNIGTSPHCHIATLAHWHIGTLATRRAAPAYLGWL